MLSKGWGCYVAFTVLVALAIGSYAANQARGESSPLLDALTLTFAGLAVVFLIVGTTILLLWAARWICRYFHTVEVQTQQWYCRYWPLQRLLQVSGVPIITRDWAGKVSTLPRFSGHLDCGEILAQRGVQDGHTISGRVPPAGGGVSAAA